MNDVPGSQEIIRVRGLTKQFESSLAVDHLDLTVESGELLTLLGPSGCGKTTTLRCIAGLEKPDHGDIELDGTTVVSTEHGLFVPPEKRKCGMVFQSYALWPHMTAFSNISYPLKRAGGMSRPEMRERVDEMLHSLGLGGYGDRFPAQLSGGQQQRVALARALISQPRLVLLDEPLSNLDAKLRAQMRVELRSLHERFGTTMVYVTHDQAEAMVLSDRVLVMDGGRVQQFGTPQKIYKKPANRFVADFMGFENLLKAEVTDSGPQSFVARLDAGGPQIRCASPTAPMVGDTVELAARSSTFTLSRQPLNQENSFDGIVESTAYLGHAVEYRVRVGGTLITASTMEDGSNDGTCGLSPGDSVHLCIHPDKIIHGLVSAS